MASSICTAISCWSSLCHIASFWYWLLCLSHIKGPSWLPWAHLGYSGHSPYLEVGWSSTLISCTTSIPFAMWYNLGTSFWHEDMDIFGRPLFCQHGGWWVWLLQCDFWTTWLWYHSVFHLGQQAKLGEWLAGLLISWLPFLICPDDSAE